MPSATDVGRLFPPLDRRLGIPRRGPSSLKARKICEANQAGSFQKASRMLQSLAGMRVSAKEVQRIAEGVGAVLLRQRDRATRAFFALERTPEQTAAPEADLLVITTDGGRVQTRQEDPDQKWKEDKVGVVYEATPGPEQPGLDYQGPPPQARSVVATMHSWDSLGDQLSALADRRGYTRASQTVFVSDGAPGIRSLRQRCFPDAQFVLDWTHAKQHIYEAALAGFGAGQKAQGWYERQKDRLWNGRSKSFFTALSRLSRRLRPPRGNTAPGEPGRVLENALDYFRTNRAGLQYPHFRSMGWPVGSGVIESTIKQIGKRVKGTEKHWSVKGVEETLQVVASLISTDQSWHQFWDSRAWAQKT